MSTHQRTASPSSSLNTFVPTVQLDIKAVGYDDNQALIGKSLENITIHQVDSGETKYTSFRLKRSSNSCALVRGSDPNGPALIATIYRWGPGRHPRIKLFPPNSSVSVEEAINSDAAECEVVDVRSRSVFKHTQKFETSLGAFEWRDGSDDEKEACNATSLMVMERFDQAKNCVRVAQFVRNDELRTPGTKKGLAGEGGSGGRLMVDLSMWAGEKASSADDMEAFTVASCLCMLKREADRFQNNTQAIYVH